MCTKLASEDQETRTHSLWLLVGIQVIRVDLGVRTKVCVRDEIQSRDGRWNEPQVFRQLAILQTRECYLNNGHSSLLVACSLCPSPWRKFSTVNLSQYCTKSIRFIRLPLQRTSRDVLLHGNPLLRERTRI